MSARIAAPARVAGNLFAFILDIAAALFKRPFQLKAFLLQAWFIVQVTIIPSALVSIPVARCVSRLHWNRTNARRLSGFLARQREGSRRVCCSSAIATQT